MQRALEAGQPHLAVLQSRHSIPWQEKTPHPKQTYPEFAASVTLVDVDVYDQRNARLLQTAHIRTIPTLIFFDRAGQGQVHMGVLEAGQLRQTLTTLGGGH